jgi:hypothetical protein
MSVQPDHELEILEYDQTIPPRPEEVIADATRTSYDLPEAGAAASPEPAN